MGNSQYNITYLNHTQKILFSLEKGTPSVLYRDIKGLVCIRKIQVTRGIFHGICHSKALHNYSIPCLNLRKTYGNFGKSSEISAIFRKLQKRLKPVFEEFTDDL